MIRYLRAFVNRVLYNKVNVENLDQPSGYKLDQENRTKERTTIALEALKVNYLALKEKKINALDFGGDFVVSLSRLQDLGVLNQPEIQKAVRSLGGLGEKQPAIYIPLLGELKRTYLFSKESGEQWTFLDGQKSLELATLVGMDNDPGITGQAIKRFQEYFNKAGVKHNFGEAVEKVDRSNVLPHWDKPARRAIHKDGHESLLKKYGVTDQIL